MDNTPIIAALFVAAALPTSVSVVGIILRQRDLHHWRRERLRADLREIREHLTVIQKRLAGLEAR